MAKKRKGKRHRIPNVMRPVPVRSIREADRTKREHIMIGVPAIDNYVTVQVLEFVMALDRAGHADNAKFTFSHFFVNGVSPHETARNVIVGKFLKSDASRLWFIDADMLPQSSGARLLHAKADISAAKMYRFDHANPTKRVSTGVAMCAFLQQPNREASYVPIVPAPGVPLKEIECDAVGTGSMIIKRRVLEDKRMWAKSTYVNQQGELCDCTDQDDSPDRYIPPVFQTPRKPNGAAMIGEDLDFCRRAKALGYTISVDLGAEFGHYKPVDLDQVVMLCNNAIKRANENQANVTYTEERAKGEPEQVKETSDDETRVGEDQVVDERLRALTGLRGGAAG